MKHFRIAEAKGGKFVVQERVFFFLWITWTERDIPIYFESIAEARKAISIELQWIDYKKSQKIKRVVE